MAIERNLVVPAGARILTVQLVRRPSGKFDNKIAGSYYFDVSNTMAAALRDAAIQMRKTHKPVGIIVWGTHGGHAWVMTGFTSDHDPLAGGSFTVTSIQAMGPLWPLGTIDGHSYDPGPKTWVGMAELTRKFTAYYAPKSPEWVGKWLTVLPG